MSDRPEDAVAVIELVEEREGYIKCPHCEDGMLKSVVDTRPTIVHHIESVRRRRVCPSCGGRATTYEIPAEVFDKLFKTQSGKHELAMRIVDIIDGEVRTELQRLLTGSPSGTTITPRPEDIL